MTTTRSLFTIEQFNIVFQKLAHEKAIEAVTSLESGNLLVKGYSKGRLSEVNTGIYHIRFFAKHLSYSYNPTGYGPNNMDFEIEEKFYSTSRDCTKISFYSPEIKEDKPDIPSWSQKVDHNKTDAEKKRRTNKINDFLEKLMKESNLKPEPRFSLKNYSKNI